MIGTPAPTPAPQPPQSATPQEHWFKKTWRRWAGSAPGIGTLVLIVVAIIGGAIYISDGFSDLREKIDGEAKDIRKELTDQVTEIRDSLSQTNVAVGKLEGRLDGISEKLDLLIELGQYSGSYPPPLYTERVERKDRYPE